MATTTGGGIAEQGQAAAPQAQPASTTAPAPSPSTAAAAAGRGRVLGRYILFDAIARGGMATVHFGRLSGHVGFSRTVAIKRLHPHLATDPEFVAMFLDEARLAALIRHPNVVPTLDVVADSGEVFIVMEYVQGESLARLWRVARVQNERIPLRYILATVAGALHGLHAAHEVTDESGQPLGIVHRDVSPQNILVGSDGVARVLDFGVAKAAGRINETGDSGSLKGKIAYMAPEHIAGNGVTRQTDVYAAAVVLWEQLTNERLFDGENDAQRAAKILAAIERQVIPKPSRYNPEVSPALDDIVMRGLSWPPESRFATAKEMATLLEQNGGLVTATELGEWVTRLAGPSLTERAKRLHAIEASTKGEKPMPASLGSIANSGSSGTITATAAIPDTDQTAVAVAVAHPPSSSGPSPLAPPRSSARRRLIAIAAIGALVMLGVMIAGIGWRVGRRGNDGSDGVQGVQGKEAHPATAPIPTPVASPSTTVVPATPAPAISSVAAPSSAPSSSNSKSASTSTRTANPRTATSKPKDDCDPPYTIDAENHRIYKRNCIK